jgi:hypothetical protein
MHFPLSICGKFTRALLAHQIFSLVTWGQYLLFCRNETFLLRGTLRIPNFQNSEYVEQQVGSKYSESRFYSYPCVLSTVATALDRRKNCSKRIFLAIKSSRRKYKKKTYRDEKICSASRARVNFPHIANHLKLTDFLSFLNCASKFVWYP